MARSVFLIPVLLSLGATAPRAATASMAGRPVFAYDSDSLHATLIPMGGGGTRGADPGTRGVGELIGCRADRDSVAGRDSASARSAGPPQASFADARGAWYEVALIDKRAGTEVRFPLDAAALRKGLRSACGDGEEASPERIAAGLRALAIALKVRMRATGNGAGEAGE